MAVDMFLKVGDIVGESRDDQNTGWIDVLAWSWGASNSGTAQAKSNKGLPSFQDLAVTKFVDSSTEDLLKLVASGAQVANARLVVRRAGDVIKPINYLEIEFKSVIVTSLSTGGSGGEDRLTENVTINFGQFKYTYRELLEKGDFGSDQSFAWDIAVGSEITGPF